ncbi:MAG: hypothetical protein ACI9F2_001023 [Lysobacterales bacterium]|jgi:hypothetical protein
MRMKSLFGFICIVISCSVFGCSWNAPHKKIGGMTKSAGQSVVSATKKTSKAVTNGFKKTGGGIVLGASKTIEVVVSGSKKTTHAITSGVKKTGGVIGSGANKISSGVVDGSKAVSGVIIKPFTAASLQERMLKQEDKSVKQVSLEKGHKTLQDKFDQGLFNIPRVVKGKALHKEILSADGNLLIVPFRAGDGVAADDALDDVAIRIARGIDDVLVSENEYGSYNIIFSEEKYTADYVINGYITKIKEKLSLKKIVLLGDDVVLGVKGQMSDQKSGMILLTFEDELIFDKGILSATELGDIMGQNIARFILEQLIRK